MDMRHVSIQQNHLIFHMQDVRDWVCFWCLGYVGCTQCTNRHENQQFKNKWTVDRMANCMESLHSDEFIYCGGGSLQKNNFADTCANCFHRL